MGLISIVLSAMENRSRLLAIAEKLWVVEAKFPLRKGFLPFAVPAWLGRCSTRMTVVRLSDRSILLHSPVPYEHSLAKEIDALGTVSHVVGPNVMHNEFIGAWVGAYPGARHWVAPKTAKRNPALAGMTELSEATPIAPGDLDQVFMAGHRTYETLFFHRASRTLIATDLAYGLFDGADRLQNLFLRAAGVRPPLGVTSYSRNSVTDQKAFDANLRRVLAWDFDRVLLCHGNLVPSGGKAAFAKAWRVDSALGRKPRPRCW
jgi:hypothetical protein